MEDVRFAATCINYLDAVERGAHSRTLKRLAAVVVLRGRRASNNAVNHPIWGALLVQLTRRTSAPALRPSSRLADVIEMPSSKFRIVPGD